MKQISDAELAQWRKTMAECPEYPLFRIIARLDSVTNQAKAQKATVKRLKAERNLARQALKAVLDESDGLEGWSLSIPTIVLMDKALDGDAS